LLDTKQTHASTLAATSIFRTELRLALALSMCAGLAHSVGIIRSKCGVINSPATTFAVVIKPPVGHFCSDAALFQNYFGQTCYD